MSRQDLRSRGSRREQILDCALALFAEHGLHNVSTRQIAQAAGVSQPSLYAHFPTRDAIAAELCCRAFETLRDQMEQAGQSAANPMDRIRAIGRTYTEFGLQNEAAYRVAFMLEMPAAHVDENDRVLSAGVAAFDVLQRAFNDLHTDAERAQLDAQSAWASMHGLVSLLIARPQFPFADRQRLIETHLQRIAPAATPSSHATRNRAP